MEKSIHDPKYMKHCVGAPLTEGMYSLFEFVKVLGEGGSACVFKVYKKDDPSKKPYALKVEHERYENYGDEPDKPSQQTLTFIRNNLKYQPKRHELLKTLEEFFPKEYLIFVHHFNGTEEVNINVLMEYVKGYTIEKFILCAKQIKYNITSNELANACYSLINLIKKLHATGNYHGDLTERNVLITKKGFRLIDGGIKMTEKTKKDNTDFNNLFSNCIGQLIFLCDPNIPKELKKMYESYGIKNYEESWKLWEKNKDAFNELCEKVYNWSKKNKKNTGTNMWEEI